MPATSAATATQSRAGPRRRRSDASPPGPLRGPPERTEISGRNQSTGTKIGGENRGAGGSPPEAGGELTCALGSRGVRVCARGLGEPGRERERAQIWGASGSGVGSVRGPEQRNRRDAAEGAFCR